MAGSPWKDTESMCIYIYKTLLSQHTTIFIQLFVHVAGGASLSNEIFSGFGCDNMLAVLQSNT